MAQPKEPEEIPKRRPHANIMTTPVPGRKYATSPLMNQYEFAQLFKMRAKMISEDAPSTIDATGMIDPLAIAYREFQLGRVPLNVTRVKPNGTREIINANTLDASEFVTYSDEFEAKRRDMKYKELFY